jgi:uncharacterized membrane protein
MSAPGDGVSSGIAGMSALALRAATLLGLQTVAVGQKAKGLAQDLRAPLFLISLRTAMSRRLRRNYCWIFSVLLLAWVVKITSRLPQTSEAGVNLHTVEETVVPVFPVGRMRPLL